MGQTAAAFRKSWLLRPGTLLRQFSRGKKAEPISRPTFTLIAMIGAVWQEGSFIDLVIRSIFGADLTLYDGIKLNSSVADFDADAKLTNLNYQGEELYRIETRCPVQLT